MQPLIYIVRTFWNEVGTIGRVVAAVLVGAPAVIAVAVRVFGLEWSRDQVSLNIWGLLTISAALTVLLISTVKRAIHLENERQPKIEFQGVREQGGEFSFEYYIRVRNLSKSKRISDCLCRLERVIDQAGTTALTFLPVALPTMHQSGDRPKGRFNLDADQDKLIRVCYVNTLDEYPIRIANAEDIDHPLRDGRFKLTIRAYGVGEPVEETLIIDTRDRPILKSCTEWGLDPDE